MSQHKIDELLDFTISLQKEIKGLKQEIQRLKTKLTYLSKESND